MRGRKTALKVVLSGEERRELVHLFRSITTPAGLARRCRMVLAVADGKTLAETARLVGVTEKIVREWTKRFVEQRLDGLRDRPRPGRKPVFSPRGSLARG
jgi:predicted transcriptional regulator